MISTVQLSLLHKLPTLRLVCPACRQFTSFGTAVGVTFSSSYFSAVKQSAKPKQVAKHHHRTKHVQPRQQNRGPTSKLTDPIRPVSDKLLNSLMERHKERFPVLAAGNRSMSATNLPALSTQDLIHTIYNTPKEASWKTAQLETIEKLLTKHLQNITVEQALQACHGFYLHEHSFYQFLSQILSVTDERFDSLCPSASEITQLLFYVFIQGSAPSMLLHRVEEYLLNHLDEFHINDLGVVCVGFFRGNSRLSSQDLLDAVAEKLLADIGSLEPFLLLDFVKMFRHASYIKVSFYERLADYLAKSNVISTYTTLNPVMHIAFTYASIQVQHSALFEHLFSHAERLLSTQRRIRTKDISKFIWACGTLQFKPQNFEVRYNQLVRCFEANGRDNRDFPESIAELLMGLVYLGLFPKELLHHCLSSDVATKLIESGASKEKSMQLLLLNETAKIESPDYAGNLLSESQMKSLLQHPSVSHDLETELQTRVGLLVVLSCLQHCLGDNRVVCRHPLLHFKTAVLELWFCDDRGFLEVSPSTLKQHMLPPYQTSTFSQQTITDDLFSALTKGSVKSLEHHLPSSSRRLAIVVTSSNQFALNNQMHPLGHLHIMTRQLNKVGYTVVKVCPEDALQLELSSHEERCCHLSAMLSSALQTNIILS